MARLTFIDASLEQRVLSRGHRLVVDGAIRETVSTRVPRMLLVADDPAVASRVKRFLEIDGVHARCASSVATALAAIEEWGPDMVLLDGALVGMHAAAFCEHLCRSRPEFLERVRVSVAGTTPAVMSRLAAHARIVPIAALDNATLIDAVTEARRRTRR